MIRDLKLHSAYGFRDAEVLGGSTQNGCFENCVHRIVDLVTGQLDVGVAAGLPKEVEEPRGRGVSDILA